LKVLPRSCQCCAGHFVRIWVKLRPRLSRILANTAAISASGVLLGFGQNLEPCRGLRQTRNAGKAAWFSPGFIQVTN
jgi:hypothetical protein